MAHSTSTIANEFIRRAGPGELDPMKVLKLTYIGQGWMLGLYDEPLVWNDVEAWRYGPVFRNLYRKVAGREKVRRIDDESGAALNGREEHLVEQVWERYSGKSGLQLSAMTHAKDSPWDITYRRFGQNAVIPKRLIRDHYANLARRATAT